MCCCASSAATAAAAIAIGISAQPRRSPPIAARAARADEFSGWYLRGDIGMTNQKVRSWTTCCCQRPRSIHAIPDFDSSMLFGLGVGYQFNHWLRFDVTGEYRGKTDFTGLDLFNVGGVTYRRLPREEIGMAVPGQRLSRSRHLVVRHALCRRRHRRRRITISSFTDINITAGGVRLSARQTRNGILPGRCMPAWPFRRRKLAIELAYRYTHLGDGITGDASLHRHQPFNNPTTFKNITSHDLKLGLALDLLRRAGAARRSTKPSRARRSGHARLLGLSGP